MREHSATNTLIIGLSEVRTVRMKYADQGCAF